MPFDAAIWEPAPSPQQVRRRRRATALRLGLLTASVAAAVWAALDAATGAGLTAGEIEAIVTFAYGVGCGAWLALLLDARSGGRP